MFNFLKNRKLAKKAMKQIEEYHNQHKEKTGNMCGYLTGLEQSQIFTDLVNPNDVPVMYTGNWENSAIHHYYFLAEQIKKHPILWSFFQM
ncbi:MAG: hypothetical protein MJZ34_07925 [Paludibacteraceae bacterium]|nr:hypothetical protein [Paludibacteraceae bacterium]